tara:strand:- start:1694 stop:2632 length:939 start_codon:yes stop_codon:yes gene_type:complete
MPKTQLISCVKDEAVFMLEWVAHHHLLGFDDICIYTNDCTDGTVALLSALEDAGYCRRFDNPVGEKSFAQPTAYRRHRRQNRGDGFDHLIVLDCDEFLNIHIGDGKLHALLKAIPDGADLPCLNWRNFGDGHRRQWQPGCVTAQFEHAMAIERRQSSVVKSLVLAPEKFDLLANHSPKSYIGAAPLCVLNGALKPIDVPEAHYPELWQTLRNIPPEKVSYDIAQINHYAVKTRDSFVQRQRRGLGANADKRRHNADYFERYNQNDVLDRSIARYRPQLENLMATMRAMPKVAKAEDAALKEYRSRLASAPEL